MKHVYTELSSRTLQSPTLQLRVCHFSHLSTRAALKCCLSLMVIILFDTYYFSIECLSSIITHEFSYRKILCFKENQKTHTQTVEKRCNIIIFITLKCLTQVIFLSKCSQEASEATLLVCQNPSGYEIRHSLAA